MVVENPWEFDDIQMETIGEDNTERMESVIPPNDSEPLDGQNLKNIGALILCSKSVAKVVVPRYENGEKIFSPINNQPVVETGTGWLIGPQHLITCNHVIDARRFDEPKISKSDLDKQIKETVIQFDYFNENSKPVLGRIESLVASVHNETAFGLDFAIFKLLEPIDRCPLTIAPEGVTGKGQPVIIIQHPNGEVMHIARKDNNICTIDKSKISYFTDTEPGTSGAAVLNEKYQVVAIHTGTGKLKKGRWFNGQFIKIVNVGIRISWIIDFLTKNHKTVWDDIQASIIQQ